MGRVLSSETISRGEIPAKGAHQKAGRELLEAIFEEPKEDDLPPEAFVVYPDIGRTITYPYGHPLCESIGVSSGMVYGSTPLGTDTVRSDLDVLINYHPNYAHKALPALREIFARIQAAYFTPIEANVLPVGALYDLKQHRIDPLFAGHLFEIQDMDNPRWSYNWPASPLAFSQPIRHFPPRPEEIAANAKRVLNVAIRYASGKLRQFALGVTMYDGVHPDLKVFQRALELPAALSRKVLIATSSAGMMPNSHDLVVNKKRAISLCETRIADLTFNHRLEYDGSNKYVTKQRFLVEKDQEYNEVLDAVINGNLTIADYEEWLRRNYVDICLAAHDVCENWVSILSVREKQPDLEQMKLVDGNGFELDFGQTLADDEEDY